jgi:malate dehydrogenase (oxaloacetate-decarboxylating)
MRAVWRVEDGAWRTTLRGRQVLADPRINKGTAFGDGERRDLGLTGLIPAAHFTLDDQVALRLRAVPAPARRPGP